MQKLREYYEKQEKRLRVVAILSWFLLTFLFKELNDFVADFLNNYVQGEIEMLNLVRIAYVQLFFEILIDLVAPASIVIVAYNCMLKYVDEKGWKKRFPQYDISGEWNDITTYSQFMDKSGLSDVDKDKKVKSPVSIEQTCHKITITTSVGSDFKWYSILCDWNNGNLDILYAVEYFYTLQQQGYPAKRYGYERMSIDMKERCTKQRPNKMVGQFWHCCSADGKPVYMGDVIYERKQ